MRVRLIEKLVLKLKARCNFLKNLYSFGKLIYIQLLEIKGNCVLFKIFHLGTPQEILHFHYEEIYFFPELAFEKRHILDSIQCIFFCLGFVLDFSRSGKVFSLFFSHVETVFFGTTYFLETSYLLMLFSKSFNALNFSSTVLIFRCLFHAIIEKFQFDKPQTKQMFY